MVYSVLKRRTERDERIENQKLITFSSQLSKFEIKYYSFY
jgi:hypothetical protein